MRLRALARSRGETEAQERQTAEKSFQGRIELDVRDSTPDWDAFLPDKAPEDAPNVLVVLYDDTGCAAWSPYGGRIEMPTMQRLADDGLTYSQWHTTALCSPTRSVFLTGLNHNQNGFASISESASGFPGYNSHIPPDNASMATVLRDAGWSTFWVGKNHNTPVDAWTMGSSKKLWPLGLGYDRFYGFIGGETNQWYPELAEDNHYIDQPYQPEDGYHLSKDLADQALKMIRDSKQSEPGKPWYLWFCPGANHAPHHAPQEFIDKYKGKFDDGYEAYREWVLPRMIERGILPEGTELTPLNPMTPGTFSEGDSVRPWDELSDEEKALFSRMAEVYAGFSEYTDHQVGRIVEYLEESGQLDNTLIIYCADNGASGEGSPNGSVNENKFFNAWPDDIEENLRLLDKLGGPEGYNHYPTGWAVAFSTPYRMFKRYSYQGGVADPLVIHWPKGISANGEVRSQYHHCTDIVPTILDCCGVEMPDVVNGVEQTPLPGVSMGVPGRGPVRGAGRADPLRGARQLAPSRNRADGRHGGVVRGDRRRRRLRQLGRVHAAHGRARPLRRGCRARGGHPAVGFPRELHLRAGAEGVHRGACAHDHHWPDAEAVRRRGRGRRLLRAALGLLRRNRRHPRAHARCGRRLAGAGVGTAPVRPRGPGIAGGRAARHRARRALRPRRRGAGHRGQHRQRPALVRPPGRRPP